MRNMVLNVLAVLLVNKNCKHRLNYVFKNKTKYFEIYIMLENAIINILLKFC